MRRLTLFLITILALNFACDDDGGNGDDKSSSVIKSPSFVMDVLGVVPIAHKTFQKNKEIDTIYVSAKGGKPPYTYSISGAPSGITIDANSGLITGTPSQEGKFNVTVTVTDSVDRTSSYPFTMSVYSKALAEKFSPILVLTEDPNRKGYKVIFPEPVEIMGAMSVDSLKFYVRNTLGEVFDVNLTPSWHTHLNGVYQHYNNSINLSEDNFAFLPFEVKYTGKPPDLAHSTYVVFAYFDYPGKKGSGNNNWYDYYFPKTNSPHSKAGVNFDNTAYVHIFERHDGRIVIQYYYFYPFNNWKNNHEGDWQYINVVVSSFDPNVAEFMGIDYIFHDRGLTYNRIGGRTFNPRIQFAPAEGGTHPVVYVGAGSHGNYPTGGNYSSAGYFMVDEDLTKNGIVLSTNVQNSDRGVSQSYDLILLPNPDPNQPNMGLSPEMSWLGTGALWGTPYVDIPWFLEVAQFFMNLADTLGISVPSHVGNKAPQGPFYAGWRTSGASGYGSTYDSDNVPYTQFQHFPIVQDLTWRGNIELIGDIVVYPGATLTIEAGATITAHPNRDIHVWHDAERVDIINYGTIVANGSSGQRIVFRSNSSNPMPGDWYGITNHGNLTMRNVVIRDAVDRVRTSGSGTQTLTNVQYFNMGTDE